MKIRKLQLAILAASLAGVMSSKAVLYDITFTEANSGPTVANGQIDVEVFGADTIATSGFLDVTGGPITGTIPLLAGSWFHSPSGAFDADNKVYLPPSAQFLDLYGLLFKDANSEFNLWGNGDGTYTLYGWTPARGYCPTATGAATLTPVQEIPLTSVEPVPEPTTMLAGAMLLLPFGVSTLRIVRRNRKA
jgi:hypothetical protein